MYGLVVRFDLRPACETEFDHLVDETVAIIRAEEPGTLLYLCHQVADEPGARVFYELYRDREAFDLHERQPHVQRFLRARAQYLTAQPRVEFLAPVGGKGLPAGCADSPVDVPSS